MKKPVVVGRSLKILKNGDPFLNRKIRKSIKFPLEEKARELILMTG